MPQEATSVPQKGFNFAVAPKRIPVKTSITSVEAAIKDVEEPTAEAIRQDVSKILREAKPPQPNIRKEERQALRDLRKREDLVILQADKGNSTVVMEKQNYIEKMLELLNDGTYEELQKDVNKQLTNINLPEKNLTLRKLTRSDPVPPRLYGLLKIHKEDIPMRTIVSSIGSPTYYIAQHLTKILKPNIGNTDHHIKNSKDFIEKNQPTEHFKKQYPRKI